MTDEQLLKNLKKRQRNSLEQAIDIYTPYVSTVIYNTVGSQLTKEDTEEITADVFIGLWKSADNIDLNKGSIRSYLAAIAKNCALKRLQKKTNDLPIELVESDAARASYELAEPNDLYNFVWQAVAQLGEPDNEIFVRYYKYGQKLREIAKITNVNLSTVKTKLLRGKQKLKKILSDKEE